MINRVRVPKFAYAICVGVSGDSSGYKLVIRLVWLLFFRHRCAYRRLFVSLFLCCIVFNAACERQLVHHVSKCHSIGHPSVTGYGVWCRANNVVQHHHASIAPPITVLFISLLCLILFGGAHLIRQWRSVVLNLSGRALVIYQWLVRLSAMLSLSLSPHSLVECHFVVVLN